jgi:hypothetical protein
MKNLEEDLLRLKTKIVKDKQFAKDVYNALCNMRWKEVGNPGNIYSCSWRYAGGLIAEMRGNPSPLNHMDFYCSGSEGVVTEQVENIFYAFGWVTYPWEDR